MISDVYDDNEPDDVDGDLMAAKSNHQLVGSRKKDSSVDVITPLVKVHKFDIHLICWLL